jgi:diguanylate cyclase (GGDEF)-like protein
MSTLVPAFASGVLLAALTVWGWRKARALAAKQSIIGDQGTFLADLSRSQSPEFATATTVERLRSVFGIDRVVYLRGKGHGLQVDIAAGVADRIRNELVIPNQSRLSAACTESFAVRPSAALFRTEDATVGRVIAAYGLNFCLPIFWGRHLYGLILFHLPESRQDAATRDALGAISQTLSAVFHLQWERHKRRVGESGPPESAVDQAEARPARQILRLVRHRNSETVVRRLISAAQSEIGLEKFVCMYEPREKTESLHLVTGGTNRMMRIPQRALFKSLAARLETCSPLDLKADASAGMSGDELSRALVQSGLTHAKLFPLSSERRGIFAWADRKPAAEVAHRLDFFNDAAAELVENAESFERIEELSHTDPLTGLRNQRYLQSRLAEEINRARRYGRSLGLVMIDVDMLKAVNDRYGHQAGDAILCQMGKLFKQSVRDNDVIARYGGDEFCVVMPEADLSTCELFMARIRTWLATTQFTLPGEQCGLTCTISLGAAVFPDHAADAEKLIFAADMALLKAKERGKNTFQVYNNGS